MNSFVRSLFIFLVFVGGLIIAALTLVLIACLHIVKLFFKIFIQREKLSKSKGSAAYHYSESSSMNEQDVKRRRVKTIDAEVVSAESKTINS